MYSLKSEFNWSLIEYELFNIDIEIHSLEAMINSVDDLINNEERELENQKQEFQKEHQDWDPQLYSNYESQAFSIHDTLNWNVSKNLRNSIVLILYSYFEGKLRKICKIIENEFRFKIKLEDLNRSDNLSLYLIYLSKVYSLDLTGEIEKYLTLIKQQRIIRNIIAHQESSFNVNQKDKIQKAIGLKKYENTDGSGFINITNKDYNLFLLNNIKGCLKNLSVLVDKQYIKKKTEDNRR